MMKGFWLTVTCLTILLTFIQLKSSSTVGINQTRETSQTIDEFWKASLQEDTSMLNEIISSFPDDFYKMWNKCEQSSEQMKLSADFNGKSLRVDLLLVHTQIKKQSLESYKILEERVSDNHAAVRVEYGKSDKRIYEDIFLLNKESGKWKIFMVTNSAPLSKINKYFAQNDCEEKSITERFWKSGIE